LLSCSLPPMVIELEMRRCYASNCNSKDC